MTAEPSSPASMTATVRLVSSESLEANARPPAPPPTMIKSYACPMKRQQKVLQRHNMDSTIEVIRVSCECSFLKEGTAGDERAQRENQNGQESRFARLDEHDRRG